MPATPATNDSDLLEGLDPARLVRQGLDAEPEGAPPGLAERLARALPEYEIGSFLGRGGMGAVFRARQRKLDRTVAIKVLLPAPDEAHGWIERFEREARALARLNHPNIIDLYDFGQVEELLFLAVEYVDGASLRDLLREGKLAPEEALAIVPQLCDALQYAHSEGVVHRDIKPENILLDGFGRVKIADFGLAKIVGQEKPMATLTGSRQAMGTFRYMAPEQIDAPRTVDHRADLFSMGVVMYEMLTGEAPAGHYRRPSERAQVDARLDDVVQRALEREPERRYQQAREMKGDVERVVRPAPAQEAADPAPQTGMGLDRWFTVAACVAGVVLTVADGTVHNGRFTQTLIDTPPLGFGVLFGFLVPLVFAVKRSGDTFHVARLIGVATIAVSYLVWNETAGHTAVFTDDGMAYVTLQAILAGVLGVSSLAHVAFGLRRRLARRGMPAKLHERLRAVSIFLCVVGVASLFLPWRVGTATGLGPATGWSLLPGVAAGVSFLLCGALRAAFEGLGMRGLQGLIAAFLGACAYAMAILEMAHASFLSGGGAFLAAGMGVSVMLIGVLEWFLPAPAEDPSVAA